jgi:hypothetical protein
MDPGQGRFLNRNYTGYLVPTSADVPDLETLFVASLTRKRAYLEQTPRRANGRIGRSREVNAVYHTAGKHLWDLL